MFLNRKLEIHVVCVNLVDLNILREQMVGGIIPIVYYMTIIVVGNMTNMMEDMRYFSVADLLDGLKS